VNDAVVNSFAWQRAADGVQMATFGVFLLLTTQGVLPWSFWAEAASFWPVLLVGLGLRVIFEGSRMRWAVLLSPLLVIATLTWVARGQAPGLPGDWVSRSVSVPDGAERWTLAVRLASARLDLTSSALAEGLLADGRSASRSDRGRLDLRRSGSNPVVRLDEGADAPMVFGRRQRQAWELRLDQRLPVGLDLRGAFLDGRLDLASGRVTDGNVDGAGNDFELRLPRPEKDVALHLKGVFNALRLVVPASTPVRVRIHGPFNSVDRLGQPGPIEGPGYDVQVEGVMNRVVVEGG
jgi:hypothetical protein